MVICPASLRITNLAASGSCQQDHRRGLGEEGQRLLHGQQAALGIHTEDEVELLRRDVLEEGPVAQAGIGHDGVQLPPVTADHVHDVVEVGAL
jgi:hypothetical protein